MIAIAKQSETWNIAEGSKPYFGPEVGLLVAGALIVVLVAALFMLEKKSEQ